MRPRSSQFLPDVSVHLLTLSLSGCPSRASVQPCSQIPKLSFSFDNGRKWAVRPVDMNLGRVSSHSQYCVGAVAGVDIGLGDSTWILGCSFLKVRDSSSSRHHRLSEGLTIVLICRTSTLSSILPTATKSDSQLPSEVSPLLSIDTPSCTTRPYRTHPHIAFSIPRHRQESWTRILFTLSSQFVLCHRPKPIDVRFVHVRLIRNLFYRIRDQTRVPLCNHLRTCTS